jgi:hypothetical protein
LIVGQPESFTTELLLEGSILLSEIFDDCVLLLADPTGKRCHEDLPGLEDGGHRLILPTLQDNRQLLAGWQTS